MTHLQICAVVTYAKNTGGDTYTAGAAIAAPFANMGRQHIIIAAPTLALASSDNFLCLTNSSIP